MAEAAAAAVAPEAPLRVVNRLFNYAQFFDTPSFSDFTVVYQGRKFQLHKFVYRCLSCGSDLA